MVALQDVHESALVIEALVEVATRSLPAISRLVDVNRGIATQSLPALRMGPLLRPKLGGLLVRPSRDVVPPVVVASAGGER